MVFKITIKYLKNKKYFTRTLSAIRYLSMMDIFYKWRIKKYKCHSCGGNIFIQLRKDNKFSKCISDLGFSFRCLKCKANLTNVALIPVIKKHQELFDIRVAWEMSTYGATFEYLKNNIQKVFGSEFVEGKESGTFLNKTLIQDVQKTSFHDNELDLITCNQVFEHVPNLEKSFIECYRVLKKKWSINFQCSFF